MGDVIAIQFGRRPVRRSLEQRKKDFVAGLCDAELRTLFQCNADARDPQSAGYRLRHDAAVEMKRRGILASTTATRY